MYLRASAGGIFDAFLDAGIIHNKVNMNAIKNTIMIGCQFIMKSKPSYLNSSLHNI